MATRRLETNPATPALMLGIWGGYRPRWLAGIGAILVVLAAAGLSFVTRARFPAHAWGVAVVVAGCLGLSLLAAGIWDAMARRRVRRAWLRLHVAAWHPDPDAPLEGYHVHSPLRPAGFGWGSILRWLSATSLAGWLATRVFGLAPSLSGPAFAAFFASLAVVSWNRRAAGRVSAGVLFPEPLTPGRAGDLVFQIAPGRADLPPESFAFSLRCTRSYAEDVAEIPPASQRMVPGSGARPKWTLTFEIPADAQTSDLLADPPVRWELVVSAAGPTAAYEDRLAVPVLDPDPRGGSR